MNLQVLVYSPLMEEEPSISGWSKETIDYINKNKSKVMRTIKSMSRSLKRNITPCEVEDIYSEVYSYLYKCDDYNLSKAIERSKDDTIVSIDGYISSCVKFCVIRYLTSQYKIEKQTVREYIESEGGKELSIFDTLVDYNSEDKYNDVMYSIEQQCEAYEYARYSFGVDIYLVWYVRLLTIGNKAQTDIYYTILEVLGISKRELNTIKTKMANSELMRAFAKAVALSGVEKSIEVLERYVYSAHSIKDVVKYCS